MIRRRSSRSYVMEASKSRRFDGKPSMDAFSQDLAETSGDPRKTERKSEMEKVNS